MEKETSFSIHLFYWLCGQLDKGGIHSIQKDVFLFIYFIGCGKFYWLCGQLDKGGIRSIQKDVFPFIYFIGCMDNWTKVVFTQSAQTIPLNLFHTVPTWI